MSLYVVDEPIRTLVKTTASGAMSAVEVAQSEYVLFRLRNTTASGGTKSALRVLIQGSMDKEYWHYMPSGGTWPYMYKLTKFNKTATGELRMVGVRQPFLPYLRLYAIVSGASSPAWTIEAKAQRYESRVD